MRRTAGAIVTAALVATFAPVARAESAPVDPSSPVARTDPASPAPSAASGTSGSGSSIHPDGSLSALVATPYAGGDFGVGFLTGLGAGWGHIPISVGLDFMAIYWGSQNSDIVVPTGSTPLPATLHRSDWTVGLELWARVQPPYWIVRPYLEGFVGGRVLQSSYSLTFVNSNTSTNTNGDADTGGQFGWGIGVDLPVSKDPSIVLTLGFRSVSGARASFTKTEQTSSGSVLVHYDFDTNTNLFLLGIAARFDAPPRVGSTQANAVR